MFKHKLHQPLSTKIIFSWFLMSFNAGSINAGGFLCTGKFVSHVTGFSTLFGINLVGKSFIDAFELLLVPVAFMGGAFLSGLLIDRPIYHQKKPHFDYVMGLSALCLFTAGLLGRFLDFGPFGSAVKINQNFLLLLMLCLACGLQNAALTSSSGNSVRTTHLTGVTTDLGLGLARLLTIRHDDSIYPRERRSNILRLGTIFSFIIGSTVGSWVFLNFKYEGFFMCGFIALYGMWIGHQEKHVAHKLAAFEP